MNGQQNVKFIHSLVVLYVQLSNLPFLTNNWKHAPVLFKEENEGMSRKFTFMV
jgi:hypothetical protein